MSHDAVPSFAERKIVFMKRILFITGTRADFGKIKSLISNIEKTDDMEAYVYVTGMHLLQQFGKTYDEVLKENYKNVYVAYGTMVTNSMSYNLGNTVTMLTGYVNNIQPDMIVVHGDRTDALAGAIVGAFNNIAVAHIEGGELSGTIDESTRHAISKFAHIHFVCNESAKMRLRQMGEEEERIFVIGSPDIDVMMSDALPSLGKAKERYEIEFERYGILMYHPVTTEYDSISEKVKCIVKALEKSGKNYIVIYPNNDMGSELIINEYTYLRNNSKIKMYPSLRFEYFLTLLKNADFIIGNSSAGVREACIYGIPTIDIGSRQQGRYSTEVANIQHVEHNVADILTAIRNIEKYRIVGSHYGHGNSAQKFVEILSKDEIWDRELQKRFVDIDM